MMSNLRKSIVKNTSKYLEIYDEAKVKTTKLNSYTVESYTNKEVSSVTSILKSNQIRYIVLGNGDRVVSQYPIVGEKINKIDKVFLLTNGNEIKMPNIVGYSAKDFYNFVNILDLPHSIDGIGYVLSQSIPPDSVLDKSQQLDVKMGAKY